MGAVRSERPDLQLDGLRRRPTMSFGKDCTGLRVRVESVDPQHGSKGEGSSPAETDAEEQKHGYQRGLDTPVVHALTDEFSGHSIWVAKQLTRKNSA